MGKTLVSCFFDPRSIYTVFHKQEIYSWCYLCQIVTDFHILPPADFLVNLQQNKLLKISPHLANVATLLCERLMLENKRLTMNYKVA